jgi:hypothetical protein
MKGAETLAASLIGAAVGVTVGLASFYFFSWRQSPGMGMSIFMLVPMSAGFAVAQVAPKPNSAATIGVLSVVGSLVVLVATGREGALCAVLAFPLIAAALAVGLLIGILVRKIFVAGSKNRTTTTGMFLLIVPLLIVGGQRIETPSLLQARAEVVQTSVEVNGQPLRVWGYILSIDSVEVSKPMLMYVGLPIPERCILKGAGLGAKRTCYFNSGYIEETVTEWNPPYRLGLSIDRTHMPGRHWLGFESAEYRLQAKGANTLLTRSTTVTSHLRPVWYWRPLERLGVESEHEYILRDVVRRAKQ